MARIRTSRKWFDMVRRKFFRSSSHTNSIVLDSNACSSPHDGIKTDETASYVELISEISLISNKQLTQEDLAAMKIQAIFRGHLVRYLIHCNFLYFPRFAFLPSTSTDHVLYWFL